PESHTLSLHDALPICSETVAAGISRRSLARALAQAATDVPGITRASAVVRRRRAVVDATTLLRDPGDLADRAQERVERLLDSLADRKSTRLNSSHVKI